MDEKEIDKELGLDLDSIEANEEKKLSARNRYQQLAEGKIKAQQEKEIAEAKATAAEAKTLQLEKEKEFFKTFSQLVSKYPHATDYQDQILERVNKGYDQEEATLAVLAKEGKLANVAPLTRAPAAEGGSAITNISEGDKPLDDMPANEKLDALREMERSGDLARALRAGINRS